MAVLWQVLAVEDNDDVAATTKRVLEQMDLGDDGIEVVRADDLQQATSLLAAYRYDLLILDIRDDEAFAHQPDSEYGDEATPADVGLDLYEEVRKVRFVPVIFYSAVAQYAAHLSNEPFVTVLSKLDTSRDIQDAVRDVIASRLPKLNRALAGFVDERLKDYLGSFVAGHWAELNSPEHQRDLAHMLARRLVRAFDSREAVDRISLGVTSGWASDDSHVDPMRVYLVPPTGDWTTGDVVRIPGVDDGGWSVMLTPACDLVEGRVKADYVLLARCQPLSETDEHGKWVEAGMPASGNTAEALGKLLRNNRKGQVDRYWFLPPAWDVPGLVVDFQRVEHVPYADLVRDHRVASVDDPYVQALVNRFGRFVGRTGTPDVDTATVIERLRALQA